MENRNVPNEMWDINIGIEPAVPSRVGIPN